jgi:hypothetical protein
LWILISRSAFTGILGLLIDRNGVDVLGGGAVGNIDSLLARLGNQAIDQVVGTLGAFPIDHTAQCVLPFLCLLRVGIGDAGRQRVFGQSCHDLSPGLQNCEVNGLDGSEQGNTLPHRVVPQRSNGESAGL